MFTPIEEGKQVKGEITHILLKPQIEYIASSGLWWVVISVQFLIELLPIWYCENLLTRPKHFECPVEIKPSTNQQVVPATSSIPEDMLPSSSEDEDDDDDSVNEFKIRNPNRNYDDDDDDEDIDEDSDDECQNKSDVDKISE